MNEKAAHRWRDSISEVGRAAFSFFLPRICAGCSNRIHQEGTIMCSKCISEFPAIENDACPRCSIPNPSFVEPLIRCKACPPGTNLRNILAAHLHAGTAQTAVMRLKYAARAEYADILAGAMAPKILDWARTAGDEDIVLIPVPIHPTRLRERGFNQSTELARAIGRLIGCRVDAELLSRVRPTPSQTRFDRRGRISNMQDAFVADASSLAAYRNGEFRALVVDDVCTTGATLSACAKALVQAGVEPVTAAVFARAASVT